MVGTPPCGPKLIVRNQTITPITVHMPIPLRPRSFFSIAFLIAGSSLSYAQNDDCAQAISIPLGSVPFDTTSATLSPEAWPCALNGGPDLWYTHTVAVTGTMTVSLCASTYDTAVEVFTGTCGSLVSVVCNDDFCGAQSTASFSATAGATYTIRVGGYNGLSGTGILALSDGSPVINAANGHAYAAVPSVGITWDQARADAAAMTFQGIPGHLVSLTTQQENDFVYALGDVHYYWVGGFQNTASPTFSEPGGGWEWITGEPFTYTNWYPGQPDNTSGSGPENYLELLQNAQFGQTWNDAAQMIHPRGYIVEFPTGTAIPFCSPMDNNSTGFPTTITAAFGTGVGSGLHLDAQQGPNGQFGYFLIGTGFSEPGFSPPGANGRLCLAVGAGNQFGRYNALGSFNSLGQFDASGVLQNLASTSTTGTGFDVPSSIPTIGGSIMTGETWHFQLWHRENAGQSNFSNGLSVAF